MVKGITSLSYWLFTIQYLLFFQFLLLTGNKITIFLLFGTNQGFNKHFYLTDLLTANQSPYWSWEIQEEVDMVDCFYFLLHKWSWGTGEMLKEKVLLAETHFQTDFKNFEGFGLFVCFLLFYRWIFLMTHKE